MLERIRIIGIESAELLTQVLNHAIMKTLAQIIAEQREQKHFSQSQLAELSGINQAHISRIESGKSKPTMPTVFRICKALDIDPLVLADILAQEFRTYMAENVSTKLALSVSE